MLVPRVIRQISAKQVGRRSMSDHHAVASYNDLPSPQGSWRTQYEAQQRKYNARLAIGVGALVGTLVFGKAVGYLDFSKFKTPDHPAEIDSYK